MKFFVWLLCVRGSAAAFFIQTIVNESRDSVNLPRCRLNTLVFLSLPSVVTSPCAIVVFSKDAGFDDAMGQYEPCRHRMIRRMPSIRCCSLSESTDIVAGILLLTPYASFWGFTGGAGLNIQDLNGLHFYFLRADKGCLGQLPNVIDNVGRIDRFYHDIKQFRRFRYDRRIGRKDNLRLKRDVQIELLLGNSRFVQGLISGRFDAVKRRE